MEYEGFISWLFGLERFGIKLGLENVTEFLSRIGNPQNDFRTVHVTGTNGKGSVCVLLSEMLRAHGLRTGLYTSPHLVDFNERVIVDGVQIPREDGLAIGEWLKDEMDAMVAGHPEKQLTFFEFTTALAFEYFSRKKADIVVTEVGMGGRLDATNVIRPEASVITRIGLEHTNYLGSTIADIAREKAGIIKPNVGVVTCERKDDALAVISMACEKKGAALKKIGRDFDARNVNQSIAGTTFDYRGESQMDGLKVRLVGGYQAENAAAAIATAELLGQKGIRISEEEIRKGLGSARWPGRLDVVSRKPLVIFDGSHNPDGISTTIGVLDGLGVTPLTFVVGCMDDKDYSAIIKLVAPKAEKIISTQAKYRRALPAEILGKTVAETYQGPAETYADPRVAFEKGMADIRGKGLCVIGSLYLVGEAIQWWESRGAGNARVPHKV